MRPIGAKPNQWKVSADAADLVRDAQPANAVTVEAQPKTITFDLARTAIVVVDMQNDFCHPDGWLSGIGVDVSGAMAPVGPLQNLLPVMRAAGSQVVWVNWGARPDLANIPPGLLHVYDSDGTGKGLGAPLGPKTSPVLTKGSWSAQIVDELIPESEDIHVDKHAMSGFWGTPLDAILRNHRIQTILFAGVNADQCVLHTLADANFLGYDTLLIEDAAATTSPDFCMDATLYNVRQIFGFTLQSADLISAIGDAK